MPIIYKKIRTGGYKLRGDSKQHRHRDGAIASVTEWGNVVNPIRANNMTKDMELFTRI